MSLQALNTGATGMIGQSRNLDVIANNLANVGTDGFKKSRANFEDLLYKKVKVPGAGVVGAPDTPGIGIEYGVGTRVSATQLNFTPGTIRPTGRQLDIAINGPGFLQVDDGQGNFFYTRSGNLTLNSQGQVIMATATRGYVLQPPVIIPQDSLSISITATGRWPSPSQTSISRRSLASLMVSGSRTPKAWNRLVKTCLLRPAPRGWRSRASLVSRDSGRFSNRFWRHPTSSRSKN